MNLIQLALFGLLIIIILLVKHFTKGKGSDHDDFKDSRRPPLDLKPTQEVENDKLIAVYGATSSELVNVLTQFCNAYNKKTYSTIVKVNQLNEKDFFLTFPYDIDFTIYCFLVNFLYFPFDVEYNPEIRAWASFIPVDDNAKEIVPGQKVTLTIPVGKKDSDKVYITTEENISYRVEFGGFRNPLVKLDIPLEEYIKPPVSVKELHSDNVVIVS